MRHISPRFSLSASALAASLLVAACGGGGANPPPGAVPGSTGFAIDGYLRGATILCDTNGNAEADAGERTVLTDATGFFQFTQACAAGLVATGGTSIDTNLPFTGKLKAPPGATMVTPLTTLLANGMTVDQINTALGLPLGTDVTMLDPARSIGGEYQRPDLFRKTLAMQQILQKTTETLANVAGGGANAALPAIYGEVATAVAAQLRANPALLSGNALDTAALTSLVNAAATRVANSPALSVGIRAGLASVNPASLAEVVAGALKVQTDRILQSTNALIVSTTSTAQLDTRIADFALQNKGALAAAPGAAITALAADIGSTVSGGVTPPPPPPPNTGTVLISWDEATSPVTGIGAFGDGSPTVAAAPTGGSGNALRLDRSGGVNFGGTFFNVPAIPFADDRKTITAQVYATRANAVVYLKVEVPGGAAVELPATVTAANTWQTLTWNLSGVNPANSYTVMVISADTDVSNLGAQTYWVDDITLAAASGGGGGGGAFTGDFAVDYLGDLFTSSAQTSSGGDFGFFFDARLTAAEAYNYAGVAGAAQDPGGVHNFYYGKGLTGPAITDSYMGAFVKAPNNGTVDVSAFTNLRFRVWGPDQLFRAGTFPALTVVLQGPPVAGCGSNSGASEISTTFNTVTQGAASEYTLPLSGFTMAFSCSGQTVAQVLQSIAQFNILLEGTNIQYVNDQPGNAFGNGLNIGPINFN